MGWGRFAWFTMTKEEKRAHQLAKIAEQLGALQFRGQKILDDSERLIKDYDELVRKANKIAGEEVATQSSVETDPFLKKVQQLIKGGVPSGRSN